MTLANNAPDSKFRGNWAARIGDLTQRSFVSPSVTSISKLNQASASLSKHPNQKEIDAHSLKLENPSAESTLAVQNDHNAEQREIIRASRVTGKHLLAFNHSEFLRNLFYGKITEAWEEIEQDPQVIFHRDTNCSCPAVALCAGLAGEYTPLILKYLLDHGASANDACDHGVSVLTYSIYSRNLESVRILLQYNADVNRPTKTPEESILTLAVAKNWSEATRLLMDHGANLDVKAENGWTALHYAVEKNNLEILKLLLSKPSNLNAVSNVGNTPLSLALDRNHLDAAKILLEHNACADVKLGSGKTLLQLCLEKNSVDKAELLLRFNANANVILKDNSTLLLSAMKRRNLPFVKLLCKYKVDVNSGSTLAGCQTPLHKAVDLSWAELVKILLESGADIDCPLGGTPLWNAAQKGDLEMVKLLVQHGANWRLKCGVSPKKIAKSHTATYEYLCSLYPKGIK